MPQTIHARPDADLPAVTTVVPGGESWAQNGWAKIVDHLGQVPSWVWFTAAGLIVAAGLASSIRIAVGRKTTQRRVKSDKFLTFLAAGVATGVVATGMWKFFGDVLNIANPFARVALFAFFEIAMLASAFRSRRFRLDRAAKREAEPGTDDKRIDVDGIAVWVLAALSGTFAAADEPTNTGRAVRVVAPLLAAWMWERGLAGELMQFTRSGNRPNLRLTTERVLVWLRLAEPAAQAIGTVDRKRRVAQFARTAYRLHLLTDQGKKGWRVSWLRWRLRRQTEAANEHLNIATDPVLLGEVRAQLALLYGAEAGTSRAAVSDLSPLTPAPRRAISDRPHVITEDTQQDSQQPRTDVITEERASEPTLSQSTSHEVTQTANGTENAPATPPAAPAANTTEKASEKPAKTNTKPAHPLADHSNESVRKLARAFSKKPGGTNPELAKLARVSIGTANRYMAEVRAAFTAAAASEGGSQERPVITLNDLPIAEPTPPVTAGTNGHPFNFEETT